MTQDDYVNTNDAGDIRVTFEDIRQRTGWSERTLTRRLAGIPREKLRVGYGYSVRLADILPILNR